MEWNPRDMLSHRELKLFSMVKFTYSEKATKFCEISTVDLSYVHSASQIYNGNFAFSEYMNFTYVDKWLFIIF